MKKTIIFLSFICLLTIACSSQTPSDKQGNQTDSGHLQGAAYASESASAGIAEPIILSEMTLDEAITKRRSVRNFADTPLTDEQILALAWAGQGISEQSKGLRTAPSAGAKYPLELYFAAPNGVWHYIPSKNELEKHIDDDLRARITEIAVKQSWMAKAPVLVVLTGVVERTAVKYGDRAERYVLIEIGHAAQNILLKAVSMDLVGTPVGAFYDDQLAESLKLPEGCHPYYILCIGHPAQRVTTATETKPTKTAKWNKPRVKERQKERNQMVKEINAGMFRNAVRSKKVLEAMKNVPRHLFVPPALRISAYQDTPLPIGHGQTISQPYIVAYMTELLEIEPGDRVLEIGTGSGYQAAVLSEFTSNVFTIEIIDALAKRASETFKEEGYNTIYVRSGDGYYGWEEKGPFDGIIVTCAAGHIPPPLLNQLKPGGRMVVPIGGPFENQRLVLATKDGKGKITTQDKLPVVFVPMTGKAEEGR